MLCPSGVKLKLPPIEPAIKSLKTKLRSHPELGASSFSSGGERERAVYPPGLALILNSCIDSCVEVIEKDSFTPRWFSGLQFVVCGKEVGDGIDRVKKLKHDLLAGLNKSPKISQNIELHWNIPQEDENNRRLLLPVEVKRFDAEMVKQAATYAREINSAIPFRAFELVLLYNHVSDQFRFLIFHRGGLTCSEPISLHSTSKTQYTLPDYTSLVEMFMSILSWTKEEDFGYS